MKKFVTLITLLFCVHAVFAGDQLKSFEEIMEALKSGDKVSAVFHYEKCQQIADNEIQDETPAAIGGMSIDTWEFFDVMSIRNKKAFVVTSATKLIADPFGEGYVNNYVKVKIYDDNSVRIVARYINPLTFENTMDESFYGDINDGKNESGIYFYKR